MRWPALLLVGCSSLGEGTISGAISSEPFERIGAAFHSDAYILLFDREVDCADATFTTPVYTDGQRPTRAEFLAVQFYYETAITASTMPVDGTSPLSAVGLINTDEFVHWRGREGTVTIEAAEYAAVEGSFQIAFNEGEVTGTFATVPCSALGTH